MGRAVRGRRTEQRVDNRLLDSSQAAYLLSRHFMCGPPIDLPQDCTSPVAALAAAIMPPAGAGAPAGPASAGAGASAGRSDSRMPPLSLLPRRSRGGGARASAAGCPGSGGGAVGVGSGGSGEGFSPSLGSGATEQQALQQPPQQPRRQSSDTVSGGRTSLEEGGGTPRSRAQREQYGR